MFRLFDNECATCGKEKKFTVEDLPVGPRSFCSEKCYCYYAGLEYHGEGYYGLNQ